MRLTRHQTKCAAEFLVAGELVARGYDVAFTWGSNTPIMDLVVRSPLGITFTVDVKGKSTTGRWAVKSKPTTEGLFYVLVRLGMEQPDGTRVADRFYVMNQADALLATRHNVNNPSLSGFSTENVKSSLGAWGVLPR